MEHVSPVEHFCTVWRIPSTALDLWCFRFRVEKIWSWNSVGSSLTSINTRSALSSSSSIRSAVGNPVHIQNHITRANSQRQNSWCLWSKCIKWFNIKNYKTFPWLDVPQEICQMVCHLHAPARLPEQSWLDDSVAAKAGIGIQGKPFCSGRIPFEPTARTYQKNRLSSSQLYLVCIKDLYSSLGLNAAISPVFVGTKNDSLWLDRFMFNTSILCI